MGRPQDPPRSFLPLGNPFRMILPKGSSLSPKMLHLLNTFEENLAGSLRKLKPAGKEDVLSLSWMKSAMDSLCEIHAEIKLLITALDLPVSYWDDKWIDMYLNYTMKMMDIANTFNYEISQLKQGHLLLLCALHDSDSDSPNQLVGAHSSFDEWRQHMISKNSRLGQIYSVMDCLAQTLDLPKTKNSSKEKVLMQAMYGVKVVTLFICSVFIASFSGSAEKLVEVRVPETCLWAQAFADLQTSVNGEIRIMDSNGSVTFLKELEAVEMGVTELYPIMQDGVENSEELQKIKSDLEKSMEKFSEGLYLLKKEVDGFFRVVLSGRNALLSNIRLVGNSSDRVRANLNAQGQAVR